MKTVELIKIEHTVKVGDDCPYREPNVTEDTLFTADGRVIGFYIRQVPENILKLMAVANAEFLTKRVPKSKMNRSTGYHEGEHVAQFSTILGACAPRPNMRRHYRTMSSVHGHESAKPFVKAMIRAADACGELIAATAPDAWKEHCEAIGTVTDDWRFGKHFTSSISNFNIAAGYHRDAGNIVGALNVIITKRKWSGGGNLVIPDYDACIDQCDGSAIVYPAWRNVHGVTPIRTSRPGGYRNSLVFYALKAFSDLERE